MELSTYAESTRDGSEEGAISLQTEQRPHRGIDREVLLGGIVVTLLAALVATLYYLNNPKPYLPFHDSYEYLRRAHDILTGASWVDPIRMPGYPAFLAIVFGIIGRVDLAVSDKLQLAFFVLTALEVYALSYRIWRRALAATIIGVLFGTNIYLLDYVKPVLSDWLALWLTVTLALAVVSFIARPRAWRFWLVAAVALVLLMTRADWFLLPIPLFACLAYIAHRRGLLRRLVPHMVAATGSIYVVVALYAWMNERVNHFFGLTDASAINFYGKITQYHMQGQAPAKYASIARITQNFMNHGIHDPWSIYGKDPVLGRDHFQVMGAYAHAIILHHPLEFLAKSVPVFFQSLSQYGQFARIKPAGPWGGVLQALLAYSPIIYVLFGFFPIVALAWFIAFLVRRRSSLSPRIEMACVLAIMALYDLSITTLGSYNAYTRLHLATDALMLVMVAGSVLLVAGLALRYVRDMLTRTALPHLPPFLPGPEASDATWSEHDSAA